MINDKELTKLMFGTSFLVISIVMVAGAIWTMNVALGITGVAFLLLAGSLLPRSKNG